MRTAIILVLVAAVSACSDQQQQPTSPVTPRAATQVAGDVGPINQGIKLPDAKPTDQVGFTNVTQYSSPITQLQAGQKLNDLHTDCPAGSVMTGGGHAVQSAGTAPSIPQSFPYDKGWHVTVWNDQAGAAILAIRVWVLCAS